MGGMAKPIHALEFLAAEKTPSAAVSAIEAARRPRVQVHCLQDLHRATEAQ